MASWRARIPHKDTQRRLRSDSGGQRGKRSPFEKFGNFDVLKCPLLASEDEFSSYFHQFFILNFGVFTHAYAISKYKKRVPRQKIKENRSLNRFSTILLSYFRCLKVWPTSHLTHTAKSMRKSDPVDSAENWTVLDDPAINWTVLEWLGRKLDWPGPKICGFRMTEVGRYPVTLLIWLWCSKI